MTTLLFPPRTIVFTARLAFLVADCGSPFDENTSVGRMAPLELDEDGVRTAELAAVGAGVTVWIERGLGVEVAGVAVGMS